jgi:hypothetical protein
LAEKGVPDCFNNSPAKALLLIWLSLLKTSTSVDETA